MKKLSLFGGRLTISAAFIIIIVVCALMGNLTIIMSFLLALTVHEAGHLITARAVGMETGAVELLPFGAAAKIGGYETSEWEKAVLTAAAGPAANLFVSSFLYVLPFIERDSAVIMFIWAGIMMAAVNLIPALPLDGGRILYALLKNTAAEKKAYKALNALGIGFGGALIAAGLYMLSKGETNVTLFVFGVFLLGYAANALKNMPFFLFKNSEEKRRRLKKRGTAAVRATAASGEARVRDVMRDMESGKVNIITVLNADGSIAGQVSEEQLYMGFAKYGDVKMCELTANAKSVKVY